MMNMILSMIVCLAMAFSGTAALPAVPETATTVTIRNITLDNGEESVTLAPEARITAALGAEEADLHFEIVTNDLTILPASGKLTADGVQFMLGKSGRSYTVTEDTLMQLMGMDTADMQELASFVDLYKDYCAVLTKVTRDPEFDDKVQKNITKVLGRAGEISEIEIDIDGAIYPAQQIECDITPAVVLEMLDRLSNCNYPEIEAMMAKVKEFVAAEEGVEFEKFAELAEGMEDAESFPMTIITAKQDDFAYESAYTSFSDPESGMEISVDAETLTRGENTVLGMSMTMGDDTTAMTYELQGEITGPLENPTAMDLTYGIYAGNEYVYEAEAEGEEDYYSSDEMTAFMNMAWEKADGLQNMQYSMMVDTYNESGYGTDLEGYGESYSIDASCAETLEEDGSVTASWKIALGMGETPWTVSFDINTVEGAAEDFFAGSTVYDLTAEALDGTDEGNEAMTALGMDTMAFISETYALFADESVVSLIEMFDGMMAYEGEEVTLVEESEDGYEDYEEDYDMADAGEMSVVKSFDEATAVFKGQIPEFTAPEGYALDEIIVDEYTLDAYFSGENGSFDMMTYDYSGYEFPGYYTLVDGALVSLGNDLVEIDEYDGIIGSATITREDGQVYFYFTDMDRAEVEAVLAGLK